MSYWLVWSQSQEGATQHLSCQNFFGSATHGNVSLHYTESVLLQCPVAVAAVVSPPHTRYTPVANIIFLFTTFTCKIVSAQSSNVNLEQKMYCSRSHEHHLKHLSV